VSSESAARGPGRGERERRRCRSRYFRRATEAIAPWPICLVSHGGVNPAARRRVPTLPVGVVGSREGLRLLSMMDVLSRVLEWIV
jgi:hypothetical protein